MSDLLDNITYKEALHELQSILSELERGETEIDKLEQSVEKARSLLLFCEEKLRQIESKVISND